MDDELEQVKLMAEVWADDYRIEVEDNVYTIVAMGDDGESPAED